MTAIRLLVSDVDGTLVDKQKHLTPATIAAVKRLQAAGIGFTIISARPKSGIMPLVEMLELDAPVAAFNGGLVFKASGEVVEHHRIDPAVAHGVWQAIGEARVDRWVFADDRWYASTDQGAHVDSERRASAQEPVVTSDFAALLDRADKITFVSDDEPLLRELHRRIALDYGAQATIVQSQTYYLDVTAIEANKGSGIAELAAAFTVPLAATAAIGDQANDIAMLKRAGMPIAMGNASDDVRAHAAVVTLSNDADGVAHAIDTIILNRDHHA